MYILSLKLFICYLAFLPLLQLGLVCQGNPNTRFNTSFENPQNLWQSTVFAAENTPQTVKFLYDGDGVRVAKIENGKVTLYVGGIEKNSTTGEISKYYKLGNNNIIVKDGSGLKYITSDSLNSAKLLTSEGGVSIGNTSYYPYGTIRKLSGEPLSRQYIGQIYDPSTNLYFLNTRYYNTDNGLFISPDLSYDFQVNNRYAYTSASPINTSDPSGKCVGPLGFLLPACIKAGEALGVVGSKLSNIGGLGTISGAAMTLVGTVGEYSIDNGLIALDSPYERKASKEVWSTIKEKGMELTGVSLLVAGVGAGMSEIAPSETKLAYSRIDLTNKNLAKKYGVSSSYTDKLPKSTGGVYNDDLTYDVNVSYKGTPLERRIRLHELGHAERDFTGIANATRDPDFANGYFLDELQNTQITLGRMRNAGLPASDINMQTEFRFYTQMRESYFNRLGDILEDQFMFPAANIIP